MERDEEENRNEESDGGDGMEGGVERGGGIGREACEMINRAELEENERL